MLQQFSRHAMAAVFTAVAAAATPASHCVPYVQSRPSYSSVPTEIRDVGMRLFGTQQLKALLRRTKATTFSWAQGNTTLYSQRSDHTEFCTGVHNYNFSGGIAAGATVIDLGANIGDTSIQLHKLNPTANIVALEPVPITYFYLRWNLMVNKVPLLRKGYFNGHTGGVLPLHAGATADGRNIAMDFNAAYSKNAKEIVGSAAPGFANASSYNIPTLLKVLGARRHIPLLKIDCEGCEFEVLPQLEGAGVLDHVDRIVGEIHAPWTRGGATHAAYEQLKLDFCTSVAEGSDHNSHEGQSRKRKHPQSELVCFERHYRPKLASKLG